jgi:ABC-type nitrate/sulfonate/bicarbonate transport system substrate-binding protein
MEVDPPTRRRMLGVLGAGAATAMVAASGRLARAAGERTAIKINVTFRGALYTDIYVAIAKGLFEQEGLTPELMASPMSNPPVLLMTGAANVITGWPGMLYIANAQGADMAGIYSAAGVYEAWIAPPSISSPQQLGGAVIGVFTLQDLDVIYTHRMMRKFGFTPGQYTLVAAGASMDKLAAVKAEKVKAAPVYPPANFAAVKDGLRQIYDTLMLDEQVPSLYVVSASWAARNADTVVRFCRALNRAHDWLFNPANADEAVRVMVEYTKLSSELAQESYRLFFGRPGAYTKRGEWTRQQFENLAADLVQTKLIDSTPVAYERVAVPDYRERAAQAG